MSGMKILLFAAAALLSVTPVMAQVAVPPSGATPFKDTSMLKPPAGARIAIIEFEDLECYACGQASPIVWAAMKQYRIPRVHHDFIIQGHTWSRTAAIDARYLEDKVSPKTAEDFRRDVFANQSVISSPDDLQRFTQLWFKSHNVQMPFVLDRSGRCAEEVQADCMLGLRLGLHHTPTILVVTAKRWIEVTDPRQLYAAVDLAEASLGSPAASKRRN
jgi:protein-disulfide isomerase